MGNEYWQPYLEFLNRCAYEHRTIDPEDLKFFHVTDSPETACEIILKTAQEIGLELQTRTPSPPVSREP
jgi:predicted Rossmann-fold nucleotide-binding protein